MNECEFIRVTEETLPEVIDKCIEAGLYACDLETTGLNISVYEGETVDKIVGICFATCSKIGYYLPIRHEADDVNVKWSTVHREMKRLVESGTQVPSGTMASSTTSSSRITVATR
jgi:DNA polymerase I - 3''-5'' exonuclease and polymerase domains